MSEDRTVSKDGKLTGDITSLHQVGGELKATMEAICHFANQGEREITILHDYLGVSEWTVRQFIHEASFPGMIRLGKAIRLHPGITIEWLRARSTNG